MNLKYYHNLDGTRGIAALMVVVFHFFIFKNGEYLSNLILYQKITEFGQHGVSLFFVLSGFVITRILIKNRNEKDYFINFYRKRSLRIFPLYYMFLFVWYYLLPIIFGGNIVPIKLQLPHLLYIQNFKYVFNFETSGPGHFWSLAVEEHFYLLWPFVVFFVKPNSLDKAIGIGILLVLVLKYYMLTKGMSINHFTLTRIDQIMMGAYLAVLELEGFFNKKNSLKNLILIGLSIIPIGILIYVFKSNFIYLKEMLKYSILGIFFFSVIGILILTDKGNIINRYLAGNTLQYLGRISYGIYVWHFLVLNLLSEFCITKILILDLTLSVGLTILISHISYFYYEKYFLKFK